MFKVFNICIFVGLLFLASLLLLNCGNQNNMREIAVNSITNSQLNIEYAEKHPDVIKACLSLENARKLLARANEALENKIYEKAEFFAARAADESKSVIKRAKLKVQDNSKKQKIYRSKSLKTKGV